MVQIVTFSLDFRIPGGKSVWPIWRVFDFPMKKNLIFTASIAIVSWIQLCPFEERLSRFAITSCSIRQDKIQLETPVHCDQYFLIF